MKKSLAALIRSPRILIFLVPIILMAPVWAASKALYWGTPSTQFIPWWWQAWLTIRSGELPLWNPLVGMGAPLLANYQSALLYPPTWTYFLLAAIGGLPLMAWGQALVVTAHLAWAGWGMSLLIRRLGRSELAQTVGGLAFGMSGYLVARAHFLSINAAVSWLPWILLISYELVNDLRNKNLVLKLGIVFGFQWLAGHAQISWYTLILAIIWTIFWVWESGKFSGIWKAAPRFVIACLLAFGLSAAQLLPTAEYLMNSQRSSQVDFAQAATYSFWPWRLIGLVAPSFFGNPAHGDYWGYGNFWEDAIYIGLLPFLLAAVALIWLRKRNGNKSLLVFLGSLILISFFLALGNNTPLYEWLFRNVPTFALFQSPTRFSLWMVFALALLSALAVDRWRRPTGRALYWSRLAIAAGIALLLGAILGGYLADSALLDAPKTFFTATIIMGIFALAAAWLNLRAPTQEIPRNMHWQWLVAGFLAVDLLVAGWGLNPGTNLELYNRELPLSSEIAASLSEGRVFIPAVDEYELRYEHLFQFDSFFSEDAMKIRSSLLPNIFILDGISSANNYDPLLPGRYKNYMDALADADQSELNGILARMNVSVLESFNSSDEGDPSLTLIDHLPRARWVACAIYIEKADETFIGLTSGLDNNTVIIEGSQRSESCDLGNQSSVQITKNLANHVEINVETDEAGWLILADTYYPGWQVTVNDNPKEILPADGLFRAVYLEAGKWDVSFAYSPMWFYYGFGLSLVSWLALPIFWRRFPVQ
jgi:hypothetical protein